MPDFQNEHEETAFYDHGATDRDAAVALGAIVENRLTIAIILALRQDAAVADELFRRNGPLGNFGTKIRLAYMLRLIDEDMLRDLKIVNKIRNAFAHDVAITNFAMAPVTDLIASLKAYKVHQELYESEKAALTDASQSIEKALVSILRNELEHRRSQFHMCMRFYINTLVQLEKTLVTTATVQKSDER